MEFNIPTQKFLFVYIPHEPHEPHKCHSFQTIFIYVKRTHMIFQNEFKLHFFSGCEIMYFNGPAHQKCGEHNIRLLTKYFPKCRIHSYSYRIRYIVILSVCMCMCFGTCKVCCQILNALRTKMSHTFMIIIKRNHFG